MNRQTELTYSLSSRRDSGFEIEVRNGAGRRWLAEVTPIEDGNQRVDVYTLAATPLSLIDADDALADVVGSWLADRRDEIRDIARQVVQACRVVSHHAA